MNNCLNCKSLTKNPKFCSRSCAASSNNRSSPKRTKIEKFCLTCGESLGTKASGVKPETWSKICNSCKLTTRKTVNWNLETKGSIRGKGNANYNSRMPYIRSLSRKKYIKSGKPMTCKVCSYDKHVDICHIQDIKEFPETALIKDINHIDNLVALCKNHHWEFDNNLLKI